MSRVAKNPITVPKGVDITLGSTISVKGPLGNLTQRASNDVEISMNAQRLKRKPRCATIAPQLL